MHGGHGVRHMKPMRKSGNPCSAQAKSWIVILVLVQRAVLRRMPPLLPMCWDTPCTAFDVQLCARFFGLMDRQIVRAR